MPVSPTYPGVYIEEIPSGVRTIIGVGTSTTAFIGKARKGPVNQPEVIHNFGDYDREFGGLSQDSTMSFAVHQYFLNGGTEAVIARVTRGATPTAATTTFTLPGPGGDLIVEASSPGEWGDNLVLEVDDDTATSELFNLVVDDPGPADGGTGTGDKETLRNLSVDPASPRFVTRVLEQQSRFVRVQGSVPSQRPNAGNPSATTNGNDGGDIQAGDVAPAAGKSSKGGIYALEDADIFNLLCLPPFTFSSDIDAATFAAAASYCLERRAMLLIDPPAGALDPATAATEFATIAGAISAGSPPARNAAFFFPRLRVANPLKNNLVEEFVPCGAVAGVFARTDSTRGVWKAPAGLEAGLVGTQELTYKLSDAENGDLNPLGINCLRTFALVGSVIWGARTVQGADRLASEWKYVPVRRLALFLEETLYRNTQWVVFEPNDEPLWAQIRLNIGAFMQDLFRQGAFQGRTPREAYFVKCDKETTTQNDINRGIVNIVVGFAPLKPAEFVIIKIQQIAGQIEV